MDSACTGGAVSSLPFDPAVLTALGILAGAFVAGMVVQAVAFRLLRRFARRTATPIDDSVARHGRWPLRWLLPALLVFLVLPGVAQNLPPELARWIEIVLRIALPVFFGWSLIAAVRVTQDFALARLDLHAQDNLHARKLYTQVRILERIAIVLIVVLTLAVILMSYERLRQLGAGLLASAGIAGVIVGFAAQKTLGNLLAGFQIAITQPIRIDDVVIVEGQWGRIEEITLTYVVVRIWDLRRLVVPIGYFIEKPFENWTRTSANLLGTVFVYVDYSVPVAEVRAEVGRIVQASERWDGGTWGLQVTDATDRTLELRALMSAADSAAAWDLRCEVREKLIEYLRREHPDALPRFRVESGPLEPLRSRERTPGPSPDRGPGPSLDRDRDERGEHGA